MSTDVWHMVLLTYINHGGAIRPPAIRKLWVDGWTVDQILDATELTVGEIQAALNNIP